jgi:hypothetical protein
MFSVSWQFEAIAPLAVRVIFNVANVGGLQSQGVEADVVVLYFESLTMQNLKSSGVPKG